MAEYFDEHNCQALGDGQVPDHLMHYARLLIDTGVWNQVRKYFKIIIILQTSNTLITRMIYYYDHYPLFRKNLANCLVTKVRHHQLQKSL